MFILKFATLNINGLNENLKQIKLVEYLRTNGIQIAAIQEHNLFLSLTFTFVLILLEHLYTYFYLFIKYQVF